MPLNYLCQSVGLSFLLKFGYRPSTYDSNCCTVNCKESKSNKDVFNNFSDVWMKNHAVLNSWCRVFETSCNRNSLLLFRFLKCKNKYDVWEYLLSVTKCCKRCFVWFWSSLLCCFKILELVPMKTSMSKTI